MAIKLPGLGRKLPPAGEKRLQAASRLLVALERHGLPPIRIGAIFVVDDVVVTAGYNTRLDYDRTRQVHLGKKQTLERMWGEARALHAEIMALVHLIKRHSPTPPIQQCDVYLTIAPCAGCAQALALLNVRSVTYFGVFENNFGQLMLDAAGIPHYQAVRR